MIIIDEEKIFQEIKNRKSVSVALNAPDGLLPKVQQTASNIMKRFGIPAFVQILPGVLVILIQMVQKFWVPVCSLILVIQ